MDLGLRGSKALVTGASRGVGAAVALRLADEGVDLALAGRDIERLETVRAEAELRGVRAHAIAIDLTLPGSAESLVADSAEALGGLHVLVNNASTAVDSSAPATTDEWLSRVRGKAQSAIACARAALPFQKDAGRGSVMFVGGAASSAPVNRFGAFAALAEDATSIEQGLGNAVISSFAKHWADEVGPFGVTVNVVSPSLVMSERGQSRLKAYAQDHNMDVRHVEDKILHGQPIKRLVTPEDVAAVIAFLVSPVAQTVTGQNLQIDAGSGRSIRY